jgi:hypothetical protein
MFAWQFSFSGERKITLTKLSRCSATESQWNLTSRAGNIDWWGVVTRSPMHMRSLFQIVPLLYNTVLVLRCCISIFWNVIEFSFSQAWFSVWPLEFACLCESTWQFKYLSLFSFSILALTACFRMTVAWLQFPFLATPQSRTPVWGTDRI